jgi:hypothetical protein
MSYSYIEPTSLNILIVFCNIAILVVAEVLGDLTVLVVQLIVV